MRPLWLVVLVVAMGGCSRSETSARSSADHVTTAKAAAPPQASASLATSRTPQLTANPTPTATQPPAPELPPVSIAELPIKGDQPAFVLRGARSHAMNIVFLHGMCGHALGYAQSFQSAAADHGELVALQADVSCGGPYRRWSNDLASMSRRLDATFAADHIEGGARDLVLVGYSQGAERAEWFTAAHPEKVRGLILASGPIVPSPERIGRGRPVVLMAGTREWQGNMRDGLKTLKAAGIRATFIELPDAAHGDMGPEADRVMGEALDFIEKNASPVHVPKSPE
jgi:pimeloyl-ACP methyl ester carboxylesterase